MLTVSQRAKDMPQSATRKLVPYADIAKKKGVNVLHLNIGQPDIETPPIFLEAISNSGKRIIEYTKSPGNDSLRKSFVKYYEGIGIKGLIYENIIVTTSGSEALRFAFSVCMNPGDEVIIPEPFYTNYNSIATDVGIKVNGLKTSIEDNFDLPEVEEFEKIITPKTKAILICNPSNPTGKLYSKEAIEKLQKIAKNHGLFLISDEVYREFSYVEEKYFSALELPDGDENVIIIDSVSKRYSACGARIGCIVSKNDNVMGAVLKYAQSRLASPVLEQIGAEAMIDSVETSYFIEKKDQYMLRRDVLLEELDKIDDIVVPEISGAFYAMVELPVDDSEKFGMWMLEHFEYEGNTVMFAPGGGFYTNPEDGKKQIRIAYVLNRDDLRLAITCLREGLKEYRKTQM